MKIVPYVLLVALVALIGRAVFISGFFPLHDATHVARLALMDEAIRAGQFPPIWAEGANQGFGYPLFHFYAPLAYYFALLVKLFVGSYLTALKISFLTALLIAGFGMYRFARHHGRGVAALATTAFLLSPYFAVNLYVRGALAELWAIALFPWLFHSWRTLSSNSRSIISTAVVTTLFLLSHNLIPLITFPFLAVWILLSKPPVKSLLLASLLTVALSGFYLLPLLFERGFVAVERIARTTDYSLHFVQAWQLINSTWGFGGSAPGVEDGMSFKLGKLHLLLGALSLLLLKFRSKLRHPLIFYLLSFVFSVFLSTPYSRVLWDLLSPLQLVQFPWRFLSLMIFFLALPIGISATIFTNKLFNFIYLLFAICYLLIFNLKYFSPQTRLSISDSTYLESDYIPTTLALVIPEYLPAWMPDFPSSPAPALPATVTGPANVTLPRAYYPTWAAVLGQTPVSLTPDPDGLIKLDVPTGTHSLRLTQTHTPLETAGSLLSLAALAFSLYFYTGSRHVKT